MMSHLCGGDLKDTVSHRAEVKGNDELHDYEEEEYLVLAWVISLSSWKKR